MSFKPTKSQEKAITTSGSVLISAAAGSGKTAVLVERVIQKIAPDSGEPIPANRLLIVTFTEAAASEMRGRIEKRLLKEIRENPDKKGLERQCHLIKSADISTIDSFCIKTVRENFSILGISPDFSVGNGNELLAGRKKILDDILAPYLEKPTPEFSLLCELADCEYDESKLCVLIEDLFEKSMLTPSPEDYYKDLIAPYLSEFNSEHIWYGQMMDIAAENIKSMLDDAANAVYYADYVSKNAEQFQAFAKLILEKVEALSVLLNNNDFNGLYNQLNISQISQRVPSGDADDDAAVKVKNTKSKINSSINTILNCFTGNIESINEKRERILKAVTSLIDFCQTYSQKYYELCVSENYFTFAFCEQMLKSLICEVKDGNIIKTPLANEIISKYDEVMVDEYQDVNDLQDLIFNILSNDGEHLFTVGDVKQSIYGFRGSNPQNFVNKKTVAEREDTKENAIFLSDNFRSRKGVCEAVNNIFDTLMCGQVVSVIYGKDEKLNYSAKFPEYDSGAEAEIYIVDNTDSENKRLVSEGEAIADYIKGVMAEGKVISENETTLREARYSDFAILMRALTNVSDIIDALEKHGIPVSFDNETLLETYEVNLVLSLLKIIDNPKNDLQLLTVMMSPLFGFTADETVEIKAKKRNGSFYSAVMKAVSDGNKKASDFIDFLAEARRIFSVKPLGEGIDELYSKTDILNICSVMTGGGTKRSNLLLLKQKADDYFAYSSGGIFGFLNYLESLSDKDFKLCGTSQNGVKIMTMHKSKGLQFPVCILANLNKGKNRQDIAAKIISDRENGISFKYFDEKTSETTSTPNAFLNSKKTDERHAEEEMRVFYVAATRAKERAAFFCSINNIESKLRSVASNLSDKAPYITKDFIVKSGSMSDWILSCALVNKGSANIRKLYDIDAPSDNKSYNFNIKIVKPSDSEEEKTEEKTVEILPELKEQMLSNFDYKYPFDALKNVPAKVSVSSAANGEEAEIFAFTSKPSFMLENGLSAAGRGTAMHHVMQYISFEDGVNVSDEIARLKEWKFITEAEAEAVDQNAVKVFLESRLMKRIKAADYVRREMRFLSETPAFEVLEDATDLPEDVKVIVQGAVDLCFLEGDGITVLDFKTDKVDSLEVLKSRYKDQLSIYSKACEKILKKPVKERIIYSFTLGDYISF